MTFQLTGTDAMHSVLNQITADGQYQRQCFSAYGDSSTALASTPGFNGERRDPLTQTTHLGNGYRAYNPILMRFHAPDSMSPFGAGGINCYAYCEGDPINNSDPSGHMSAQAGVGIGLGVLGLALGAATFGVSIAAKVAVVASVAAIATGVASAATENSNPEASAALSWVSLGLGVAGTLTGLAQLGGGVTRKTSQRASRVNTKNYRITEMGPDNFRILGGNSETLDSVFSDHVAGKSRINLAAHGGAGYVSIAGTRFDAAGLWGELRGNVPNVDAYEQIHLMSCHSAEYADGRIGGIAQDLAVLTGKITTGYRGTVSVSSMIDDVAVKILKHYGPSVGSKNTVESAVLRAEKVISASNYNYQVIDRNPYAPGTLEYAGFSYNPLTFVPL